MRIKIHIDLKFFFLKILFSSYVANADSLDWKYQTPSPIVRQVVKKAGDGDIVLMHDIFPSSVDAALKIIDELQGRGYVFVTVDEVMID